MRRLLGSVLSYLIALTCVAPFAALAQVSVSLSGPGGVQTQNFPDAGGQFDFNVPLTSNSTNSFKITAKDASGQVVTKDVNVTQLSLKSVAVASLKVEPLPPERVRQLVNDGVIKLDDPDNFNVSSFTIVLTIGTLPVPIQIPVSVPKQVVETTGSEEVPPAPPDGPGNSGQSQDTQIIVFEVKATPSIYVPEPPSLPGVIVIDGRIKTLKEFFSAKFLLMNTSGIFTLQDVNAKLSFPDGGLSYTLPLDGIGGLGDILPGDGSVPGQALKEFIFRGDQKGNRRVKVDFGGKIGGPGIPAGEEVPFNGAALADVEVKGPPSFKVRVNHPDFVTANVPYQLDIELLNDGDSPALYTSLDLDIGPDAQLVDCSIAPDGEPDCSTVHGPVTRKFGDIFPGQNGRASFTVLPSVTGPVTSCMGISDQNINLEVTVGNIGCITGKFSPPNGVPDGVPSVSVLPFSNAVGIGLDSPVVALFSEAMSEGTIKTGTGGTFNVYKPDGDLLPGNLRFTTLNGRTVAIWQPNDGILNRFEPNLDYTVEVSKSIKDLQGVELFAAWSSKFTTTGEGFNDFTPPTLNLSIEPPVNATNVVPGQVMQVNAYAADQGTAVKRIELRIQDLTANDGVKQLLDQKNVTTGDKPPFFFKVDSKMLIPGHTYQFIGSAFDFAENVQDATLGIVVAGSAPNPTVDLPSTLGPVLKGIALSVKPDSFTGGVYQVQYLVDGSPLTTVVLPPYVVNVPTVNLSVGTHTLTANVTDGLNQSGTDSQTFDVQENTQAPVINWTSPDEGVQIVKGQNVNLAIVVTDPVGVQEIKWYFDTFPSSPIASNITGFTVNTGSLPLGTYKIFAIAKNKIGLSNDPNDGNSFRTFEVIDPPPAPPPAAPTGVTVSFPSLGHVSFSGTTDPNRRVDVTNVPLGLTVTVYSNGSGAFSGQIDGDAGQELRFVAFDASQQNAGTPGSVLIGTPPAITSISATPATLNFTAFNTFSDITVFANYSDASTADISAQASYSSNNPSVASVNSAGRVVPFGNGSATITVSKDGKTDTVAVTVNVFALVSIAVAPSPISFTAVGQTSQLTVTGTFTDASTQVLPSGTVFTTGNPNVAVVNASGFVTAQGAGSTNITASRSGVPPVTVQVNVSVDDAVNPIVSITSPADGTDVQPGQTVSVGVSASDSPSGVTKLHLQTSGQASITDLKQFPATPSTNQTFSFVVPSGAVVGGVINVQVTSEDAAGNLSVPSSITLDVVDTVAPTVSITAPSQQQGYGYGDVVTVTVQANDSIGVSQIRYFTEGALSFNGSQSFAPVPGARTATFQFTVPFGVVDPDVRIRAFAKDASNNEQQAAFVDIVLIDADTTPPATIATAITPPGSGATTSVSFDVTDGLADLDHVELYFRRNGIGTFNRYTNAAGGNPEGKFSPSAGNSGTIVFDSTRMGGDGAYEFYTVGVDIGGNREPAPSSGPVVVPDQTSTFSTGSAVTVISSTTTIGDSNFSFDNQNLRITGPITVTIDGAHTFRNVELLNGAKVVHSPATISTEPGLNLTLWTLTIDSTSSIDVSARGYLGGLNSGNPLCNGRTLGNVAGSDYRAGGSYGGTGASYVGSTPNAIYGSLANPVDLGSGGGCGGSTNTVGGNGGGRVSISGINVANDGVIAADGQNNLSGFQAGTGSGGSIKLATSTVSGLGQIRANGKAISGGSNEVGGGGGRIAVLFVDVSTLDRSKVQALGGNGAQATGSNGTVFFSGLGETNGTLIIDGQGANTPFTAITIPNGFTFDNIVVRNNARAIIDSPLSITGTFSVLQNSIVTHSTSLESGLVINASKVVVDSTSTIDVSGRGYRGGLNSGNSSCNGVSLGGILASNYRAGGSYGGAGARYVGSVSGQAYGDMKNPTLLGSGGGCGGSANTAGGNGGGRITIVATDSVDVDGSIRADGQNGIQGFQAGSGSGGSVKILTSGLKGVGFISANGYSQSAGFNEVGGGGGRIAIGYDFLGFAGDDLNGTRNVTTFGGKGAQAFGSAGSVYMKRSDQSIGDLYLDEGMPSGQTSSVVSPFGTPVGFGTVQGVTANTLTVDGTTALVPNGLAGLVIQPNVAVAQEYTILSNTSTVITVDTTAKPDVSAVASIGDTYAQVIRFDNVFFRRGAFAMLGDKLNVSGTLLVTENGFLSHYDATTTFTSRMEIQTGLLQVDAGSSVSASARGYLGGLSTGNVSCSGMTIPALLGSNYRAGGSYGGFGGIYVGSTPGALYGSVTDPVDLGSGGGCGGSTNTAAGDGGGSIKIVASQIIDNGEIASNGGGNVQGFQAGSGSGGSVNITVGNLSGSGFIRANGFEPALAGNNEVGGGGGRIAIRYTTLSMDTANIQSRGAQGAQSGAGNGTIFLKGPGQTLGDLVIDGGGINSPSDRTSLSSGLTFDNAIFRNNARVTLRFPLVVTGSVQLQNSSVLTHDVGDENGIQISAASLSVDATSSIDATARGYQGGLSSGNSGCTGLTLGGQPGSVYQSAGSYGGLGGHYSGSAGPNQLYGTPEDPIYLGSGGSCGGSSNTPGGNGGGRVQIDTTGPVLINGSVRADGQNISQGFQAGNGSGGSVLIRANNISGAGTISANGSTNVQSNEVGGGGGRVALYYQTFGGAAGDFNGTLTLNAFGGHGSVRYGSAGTVYLKANSQPLGDLIFDEGLSSGFSPTPSGLTPIGFGTLASVSANTVGFDLTRRIIPGGLVGVKMNPNLDQAQEFTILSNTDSQAFVDNDGVDLSSISSVGSKYAAVYRYRNVTLRRGALVDLDDLLKLTGTFLISDRSVLTHRGADLSSTSRLDIQGSTLNIDSTSRIDVSSRGYLGGLQLGNGCSGRTSGNVAGSGYRAGGSYGGLGASYAGGVQGPVYGSANNPADLGSGGGCGGSFNTAGGNGGGWVKGSFGTLILDGSILANGSNIPQGFQAGNGSGGTIDLSLGTFTGTGNIAANGFHNVGANEVGGGGGRVKVSAATNLFTGPISVATGGSVAVGSPGTVVIVP